MSIMDPPPLFYPPALDGSPNSCLEIPSIVKPRRTVGRGATVPQSGFPKKLVIPNNLWEETAGIREFSRIDSRAACERVSPSPLRGPLTADVWAEVPQNFPSVVEGDLQGIDKVSRTTAIVLLERKWYLRVA